MNRNRTWCRVALTLLGAVSAGAAPLTYSEREEVVVIERGGARVLHRYQADKSGFVSEAGDWVGWDGQAQNWLAIGADGGRSRYGADGALVGVQPPPRPRGGYDPSADVGDTPGGKSGDLSGAWQYLGDRDKQNADLLKPAVGDDGGAAVEQMAVGGDSAAKEKKLREEWGLRPGEHAGKAEAAMETGEVLDPLQKLADTVGQLKNTMKGVQQTAESVEELDEEFKNFGKGTGNYDDDDDAGPAGGGAPPPDAGGGAPAGALFSPPPAVGPAAAGALAPSAGKPPVTYGNPASMPGGGMQQPSQNQQQITPKPKVYADPADAFE